MKLTIIPPGKFQMGESPGVAVELTRPFRLGIHEVTSGQWKAITGKNDGFYRDPKRRDESAVNNVTPIEVEAYCQKLTARERAAGRIAADEEYRLPTEAEWEWACRAGTTTAYSFGDDPGLAGTYAWYAGNQDKRYYAAPVGLLAPNAWGLYDMHGNVSEFCSDLYQDRIAGGVDPQGPSEGKSHHNDGPLCVLRGGFFEAKPEQLRSAWRGAVPRKKRNTPNGFRVVLGKTRKPPNAPAQAAPAAP
jgi:formylglycine-generating enzyme required for sulfatase activity